MPLPRALRGETIDAMRSRTVLGGSLAVALALALSASPADAAKRKVIRTPGYKGITKAPATLPQQPPKAIALGAGSRPQVFVDQAGTAHITWRVEDRGTGADVVSYCRMKRGATACDNPPSSRALVPSQGDPQFNDETGTPRVVASGDDLIVLSHRYPNVVAAPDGQTSSTNTYLFLSSDGGNSFPDPAEVGTAELSGEPAVFGPPGATRIGLISDAETGGPFFQSITPGTFTRARASLGNDGISSTAAPVGSSVMVAYTSLAQDTTHLRTWSERGDIHDASTWSDQIVPGGDPRLSYGPNGVLLLNRTADKWVSRKVFPGSVSAPVTVDDTREADARFFQDPGGKLFASFNKIDGDGLSTFMRTSTDAGRTWSSQQTLFKAAPGLSADGVVGATFDGGGFAVVHQASASGGEGDIFAVPVGPQGLTSRSGLGSLTGGSADASVVETCKKVKFLQISVLAPEGCLLGVQGQPGTKVSEGTLRVNGLELVPDPGVKIVLNARARTIDSTGLVTVQLRGGGIPPIVLSRAELHLKIPDNGMSKAGACSGAKSASLDTSKANVYGFPIGGSIDVYLSGESSCFPLSVELGKEFGGVRGDVTLRADNATGLHIDSLRVSAEEAYIGPLLLKKLLVTYEAGTDTWFGTVDLGLPPQPGGIKFGADITFQKGRFKEGNLRASPPFPGVSIDPFAVTYATQFRAKFGLDPVTIGGGISFGILPAPPEDYFFTVNADVKVSFADPVRIDFTGTGFLFGKFQVAELKGFINTNAQARVTAHTKIDIGIASIEGGFDAFVDARAKAFSASLGGEVCVVYCAEEQAVISTRGVAACASVTEIDFGFGYRWGDTFPEIWFLDCDIEDYVPVAPPFRGARAAATSRTFTVASGQRAATVRLTGAGGAPNVTLISPTGQRITPVADPNAKGAPAYSLTIPSQSQTYVGVLKPAAGTWTVETVPGSPEITELAGAKLVPPPTVSGKLGGKGVARTLSYSTTVGNGLTTTFFEQGATGMKQLGVAKTARGTLRFSPGPGPGGKRTVVAVVERDGVPRLRKVLGTYTAPAPARLGRVTGVKVKRSGSALLVSWKGTTGAAGYAVRVDLSDGRRLLRVVKGSARSLRLAGVAKSVKASVSVAARGVTGRAGPAGRARV
jgi:hypothetical protein